MWKRCFKQFHCAVAYFHCKKMDVMAPIKNPGHLLKVFHSVITECHSVSGMPLIFTIWSTSRRKRELVVVVVKKWEKSNNKILPQHCLCFCHLEQPWLLGNVEGGCGPMTIRKQRPWRPTQLCTRFVMTSSLNQGALTWCLMVLDLKKKVFDGSRI